MKFMLCGCSFKNKCTNVIFIGLVFLMFCVNVTSFGAVKPNGKSQKLSGSNGVKSNNSIVLVDGFLLGGYCNGKWNKESELFSKIQKEDKFKVYALNKYLGEVIAKKPNSLPENDDLVQFKLNKINGDFVAINCKWNPMPQLPQLQSNDNATYKKVVQEILKENGVKKELPIKIDQLIRVDIDGDGKEEVFVMAENITPLSAYLKNNQYSMLFMRKIVNNKVVNIFIEKKVVVTDKEYIEETPVTYNIVGIIDVNGDGVLDLLLKSTYYEGVSYLLYDLNKGRVQLVASVESGA